MSKLRVYLAGEITARLAGPLARWQYNGEFLCRTYKTGNWKSSLLLANTVGHLAEAAWHHPDLEVSFPALTVKLQTHEAGGITDRDFELAMQIEAVVQWQPGSQGGALTGPPAEPRWQHVTID